MPEGDTVFRTATVLGTAAGRRIRPIEPKLVEIDGGLWLDTEERQRA